MDTPDASIRIKPHIMARDAADFFIAWLIACPVQLLGLIIIPGVLAFLVSDSRAIGLAVPAAIYLVFLGFSVSSLTLSPEGIRFHRRFGSPKFLPWSTVQSVEIAPRWELITKGWFWPLFPPREMTASFTSLGHYRISWAGGFCYYPPADAATFEQYVSRHLQKPVA